MGLPSELAGHFATPDDDLEVMPENWPPLLVFIAMATQWRVGVSGATGLDYAALPVVMDLNGIPPADRLDVFEAVRVMEHEALRLMAERGATR